MNGLNGLFGALGPVFAQRGKTFWLPEQASTTAYDVDNAFYFVYWVSVFFLILITVLLLWFTIKYKKKKGSKPEPAPNHNMPLEITWSVIPTLLVVVMFFWGFKGYLDLATPPADSYVITCTGQKWKWLFTYPNGHIDTELHIPANTNVKLDITSEDVLHSPYVPAFRTKQDAVPGRYTKMWFHAVKTGEFDFFCNEYCGKEHSAMITKCIVHPADEFDHWLANADPVARMTPEQFEEYKKDPAGTIAKYPEDLKGLEVPVIVGENLYKKFGCTQCHTLDGERLIGPSFKGAWGSQRKFEDGSAGVVDENYVVESILYPQNKIVEGYERVMPSFNGRLKDRQIYCIIQWLKTLK